MGAEVDSNNESESEAGHDEGGAVDVTGNLPMSEGSCGDDDPSDDEGSTVDDYQNSQSEADKETDEVSRLSRMSEPLPNLLVL